jgi:sugar-specific transcriptional regulator TrmB
LNPKETVTQDRIVSRLKELELSTYEALTYFKLLTHPNVTASTLCKETGIPDSKIYYALDGLSKKGMLIIQKGTPNIFLPISPEEAIANLKQQLSERFDEKIKEAEALVDALSPLYDNAQKPGKLEVAYIIRGQRNIISRMKALIETARKEVTLFISYPAVFRELKESLVTAKERRRIKLNVAVTQEVYEKEDSSSLGEVRVLCCSVGMLISDMKTLLTLSDWVEETAMLTQDRSMIRVARDAYDNPSYCKKVR